MLFQYVYFLKAPVHVRMYLHDVVARFLALELRGRVSSLPSTDGAGVECHCGSSSIEHVGWKERMMNFCRFCPWRERGCSVEPGKDIRGGWSLVGLRVSLRKI